MVTIYLVILWHFDMNKKKIGLKQLSLKKHVTQSDNQEKLKGGNSDLCQTNQDPFFCSQYGGDKIDILCAQKVPKPITAFSLKFPLRF